VIALAAAVALSALAHLASITVRGANAGWSVPAPVLAGFALMLLLGAAQGVGYGMLLLNTPAPIASYLLLPTLWSVLGGRVASLKTAAGWLDLTTTMQPLLDRLEDLGGHAGGRKHDRQPVAAAGHGNRRVGAAAAGRRAPANHPLRGEVGHLSHTPGGGDVGDSPAHPPPERCPPVAQALQFGSKLGLGIRSTRRPAGSARSGLM
jgi:hypothetical protein